MTRKPDFYPLSLYKIECDVYYIVGIRDPYSDYSTANIDVVKCLREVNTFSRASFIMARDAIRRSILKRTQSDND